MKAKDNFSDSEMSAKPAPEASAQSASPIRLWLVDDNDRLRNTLAELLGKNEGIECTRSFASANAAISALASKSAPDVILLDIEMGSENGLDAVRPIKTLSRATRVFMLTTFFDSQSQSRAYEDGASGFLLKRYPIEDIVESIRKPGHLDERYVRKHRKSSAVAPPSSSAEACVADHRFQSMDADRKSKPQRNRAVLERCLGVIRSFWD